MRVFLTNDFSEALVRFPKEHMSALVKKISELEKMRKSEIVESKSAINITPDSKQTPEIYAFPIKNGLYLILAFKDTKTLIVADVLEWVNGENAISWVYPEEPESNSSEVVSTAI